MVWSAGNAGSRGRMDRRAFVTAVGTAASTALAGCSTERDERDRTTDPGPVRDDAVSVMTGAIPTAIDMGPSMSEPTGRPHLLGFLHSLVLPRHAPTGELFTSEHTWRVDGTELSVPCAVDEYELADEESVTLTFDDRLAYWNGEPLDGRAYRLRDRIEWLEAYGAFREESFGGELLGDYEYRRPLGQPTNPAAARADIHPGTPPLPPSYSVSWLERFEDASTRDAVQQTSLDYRRGMLSIEEFVAEGYGTGRYEVPTTEAVTTERIELPHALRTNTEVVYAEPRSDYPGPSDRSSLRIVGGAQGAGTPQVNSAGGGPASEGGRPTGSFYDPRDFVNGDEIDFGEGVIHESKGDFFRESVPDHIEQVGTWPNPAGGGLQLTFNWANDNLRRLWVRRAVVAAAPLERMRLNQYGVGSMVPPSQSGMLGRADERLFDASFLDSLYDYPLARDTDRAAEWLRSADYEQVGGQWHGPDGAALSLTLTVYSPEVAEIQTFADGLESFGIAVEIRQLLGGGLDFEGNVRRGAFDLLLTNVPGGWSPTASYGDWFAAGDGWVTMPPVAVAGNPLGSCREDPPQASVPSSVTLPREPGALRIDGAEYGDGGATYRWDAGETVELCAEVRRLHDPETDEAGFREAARRCARWYNYALPNAVFVQDRLGLWADRSTVSVTGDDSAALRMSRGRPASPQQYHVQAGTLRPTE